jgi:GT2 family glycosyltransferase
MSYYAPMSLYISLVIPSYKGISLLRTYLPSVQKAMSDYHGDCECIVVDDGSGDETVTVLQKEFPWVRVIAREKNEGFSSAVNSGIAAALHPWILLLNNDIRVDPDFLEPLSNVALNTPDLFAVSSYQKPPLESTHTESGCSTLFFQLGEYRKIDLIGSLLDGETVPHNFATGGATLYSKEKLMEIGNFCELFNPYYYEDTELSLQGLKRGWQFAFEPRSVVWHIPSTTTKKDGKERMLRITARNYFICHWMTLDSISNWCQHLCYILLRLFVRTLRGEYSYILGVRDALTLIRPIYRERRLRSKGWRRKLADCLPFHHDLL